MEKSYARLEEKYRASRLTQKLQQQELEAFAKRQEQLQAELENERQRLQEKERLLQEKERLLQKAHQLLEVERRRSREKDQLLEEKDRLLQEREEEDLARQSYALQEKDDRIRELIIEKTMLEEKLREQKGINARLQTQAKIETGEDLANHLNRSFSLDDDDDLTSDELFSPHRSLDPAEQQTTANTRPHTAITASSNNDASTSIVTSILSKSFNVETMTYHSNAAAGSSKQNSTVTDGPGTEDLLHIKQSRSHSASTVRREQPFVDVVRNKEERAKLIGSTCKCCAPFYEATGALPGADGKLLTPEERVQLCSRHRDRFKRPPTPPGFWRLNFISTQEADEMSEKQWARNKKRKQ